MVGSGIGEENLLVQIKLKTIILFAHSIRLQGRDAYVCSDGLGWG